MKMSIKAEEEDYTGCMQGDVKLGLFLAQQFSAALLLSTTSKRSLTQSIICRCYTPKSCISKQDYKRNSKSAVPSVAVEESWRIKPGTLKMRTLSDQIFIWYRSSLPPESLADYLGSLQPMMKALFSLLFSAQILLSWS